jgi:hypothetical protein
MKLRHVASVGAVCAVLALTGCDEGRKNPGEVGVRVINAAPGFGELVFRREQRDQQYEPATLSFGGLQEYTFGVDTYDFFVNEVLLTSDAPRAWTFAAQLQANRAYTFVLTQVAGEVVPVVLENAAAPATEAQIQAVQTDADLPAMDLYLEPQGVGIAGATPRGTLSAQGQLAPRTIASGDYELFLTAAGDRTNVIMASTAFTLPANVTSSFIVMPASGQPPRPTVLLVQPGSTVLYDRNVTGEIRVINGATDAAPRDFALNGQFAPPLFSAIPFAQPTAFATLPAVSQTVNVTPVGNPGVLELNTSITGLANLRTTLLFGGPAGTLTHALVTDDGRRLMNDAKLTLLNAASQFPAVEFVVTEPGGDPSNTIAFEALVSPGASLAGYSRVPPGQYDLYLRQPSTSNLLTGPTRLNLAAGGIYGVLATNGPDTATAVITLFDDFTP